MALTTTDWIVIAAYLLLNLLISLYYRRRSSGSTEEFFVSGRNVSWWLAGTSMVATTFAADTPLLVAGLAIGVSHVPALVNKPASLTRSTQLLSSTVVDPLDALASLRRSDPGGPPPDVPRARAASRKATRPRWLVRV